MAKHARKAKKKTTTRRRRRVSGVGNIDMQSLLIAGAGAFATAKLKSFLSKDPTKTTMVNLAPYAGLAIGIGLPFIVKNPMVKPFALGMGAAGFVEALRKIAPGVVGSLDMMPVISATSNRYRQLPKLSVNGVGYPLPNTSIYKDSMSVVNGVPRSSNPTGSGSANPGY